jgi:hypothetical protein
MHTKLSFDDEDTKRHNRLAGVVRKALIRFVRMDMRSEIRDNQGVGQEDLPGELNRQRPDMTVEPRSYDRRRRRAREGARAEEGEGGREQRIIKILEFSCPYSCISHGRNTLEKVYEEKKAKYEELARELRTRRQEEVRVTAVILSSIGTVYGLSMKDLQKVLRFNDRELRRLGRQMSKTVIVGSVEIWRQNARHTEAGSREEVNEMIEEEAERMDEWQVEHRLGHGHGMGNIRGNGDGDGNGNGNGDDESESEIGIRFRDYRDNDAASDSDADEDPDPEEVVNEED